MAFTAAARVNLKVALSNSYQTVRQLNELPPSIELGSFIAVDAQGSGMLYEVLGHVEKGQLGSGILAKYCPVYVPKSVYQSMGASVRVVVPIAAWSTDDWPSLQDD